MDNVGGFANYKGVMLCTRPVDPANIVIERPFCSMVKGEKELGVNPKKPKRRRQKKRIITALLNHKRWLNSFKKNMKDKKEHIAAAEMNEQIKRLKVPENLTFLGQKTRRRFEKKNQGRVTLLRKLDPESYTSHPNHHRTPGKRARTTPGIITKTRHKKSYFCRRDPKNRKYRLKAGDYEETREASLGDEQRTERRAR